VKRNTNIMSIMVMGAATTAPMKAMVRSIGRGILLATGIGIETVFGMAVRPGSAGVPAGELNELRRAEWRSHKAKLINYFIPAPSAFGRFLVQ
jgi:hypothetical protein